MRSIYIPLGGGLNEEYQSLQVPPGHLIKAVNVACKSEGGYERIRGYAKHDSTAVPGTGSVLGVHYYNDAVYALRYDGSTGVGLYTSTGSGWSLLHTFSASTGTYEFQNYPFAGTEEMFGVSGTHKAFRVNSSNTVTEITTGMSTDTPSHLAVHKKRLFLSFSQSLQYSDLGDPTAWTGLTTGSGEIVMSGPITALSQIPGGNLGILSRNNTAFLTGDGSTTWAVSDLTEHGKNTGAYSRSLQRLGDLTIYQDDRGITNLSAVQEYGNFKNATLSQLIQGTVDNNRGNLVGSCVVRSKNQYRLFYGNGTGLIATFDGNTLSGWTTFSYPITVTCVGSGEDTNGNEVIFVGSDDGYVYQIETGNAFDGENILATIQTAYTDVGMKRSIKSWRRCLFDVRGGSTLYVRPRFQFDAGVNKYHEEDSLTVSGTGSLIGYGKVGSFIIGGEPIHEGRVVIVGNGDYLSLLIGSNDQNQPWELDGVIHEFIPRRQRR